MPPADGKPAARPWPGLKWGWQDAGPPKWSSPRAAELSYARRLKGVAGRIRQIVTGSGDPARKQALLRKYAETIGPWAEASAAQMAAEVDRRNFQVWQRAAGRISAGLRRQLATAVDGATLGDVIRRNAKRIKDLPLGAADKIGDLAAKAMTSGMRAETLTSRIAELADSGEMRAKGIARTEVSKASTALTRVRAASVGSEGYIWRTARDGDVRDSHAHMEGQFVRWDDPRRLDGMSGHAGEFPNCRCYPEPVIPRDDAGEGRPRSFASLLGSVEAIDAARNSAESLLAAAGPLGEVLAAIPDAQADYILDACLDAAEVQQQGGLGWAPLRVNGVAMFPLDMIGELTVAWHVIKANMAGFTDALAALGIDASRIRTSTG